VRPWALTSHQASGGQPAWEGLVRQAALLELSSNLFCCRPCVGPMASQAGRGCAAQGLCHNSTFADMRASTGSSASTHVAPPQMRATSRATLDAACALPAARADFRSARRRPQHGVPAQSWTLPAELNKLPGYLSEWEKRPSWEASYYTVRLSKLDLCRQFLRRDGINPDLANNMMFLEASNLRCLSIVTKVVLCLNVLYVWHMSKWCACACRSSTCRMAGRSRWRRWPPRELHR